MNNTPVVIDNITIRQDMFGRYCLNDLHQAAGGEEKTAPWRFMRLDTTETLVDELIKAPDMVDYTPINKKPGRYGGK